MGEHRIKIEPASRAGWWTAVCSCGWRSGEEASDAFDALFGRGHQYKLDVERPPFETWNDLYALLRRHGFDHTAALIEGWQDEYLPGAEDEPLPRDGWPTG